MMSNYFSFKKRFACVEEIYLKRNINGFSKIKSLQSFCGWRILLTLTPFLIQKKQALIKN